MYIDVASNPIVHRQFCFFPPMQWNLRSKECAGQKLYQHVCSCTDPSMKFTIIFDKLCCSYISLSHGNLLMKTAVSCVSKVYFRGMQRLSKKKLSIVSFIVFCKLYMSRVSIPQGKIMQVLIYCFCSKEYYVKVTSYFCFLPVVQKKRITITDAGEITTSTCSGFRFCENRPLNCLLWSFISSILFWGLIHKLKFCL